MRRFAQLYRELDQTTRTSEKLAALQRYFREAPPASAAWALYLLSGHKLMRAISWRRLRDWAVQAAELPGWLLDESYEAVGDLSETIALFLPWESAGSERPLHEIIEQDLLPLAKADAERQQAVLLRLWRECSREQRFLVQKLISGTFRVGVADRLIVRAVAELAGVEPATLAHRLMGKWLPTPGDFARLLVPEATSADLARPYPFLLAHPLELPPETLGAPQDWLADWKWDGIRAQLIRRGDEVVFWSRGEELISHQFPELVRAARALPPGTVLDGEILAWENDRPLPFAALQHRLNRKRVDATLWPETPVAYLAFDLLEQAGADIRAVAQEERRARLVALLATAGSALLHAAPEVVFSSWDELHAAREAARGRGAEGVMLKRRAAPYGAGRPRGDWWKWKLAPHTVDAVLIYAQPGSGRRASLFTDYTFGVWDDGQLVPVGKAYSGLTQDEIRSVDAFVRRHTLERHGPVRVVQPELVFELAFQGVQRSDRHRSGVALRFPRIARWRRDKRADEADTLEHVRALLPAAGRPLKTVPEWFAARGWTPFPFQQLAWNAYLAGESGLVHAPTGYGKTHAVWVGPILEWLNEHDSAAPTAPARRSRAAPRRTPRASAEALRVLWLTPLRALANDTVESLRELTRALDLPWTVELRSGDTSSYLRQRQRERLPTALVTTPESLSILLSYPDARERLASLRCVVVDEWHELLGTKRGVQTELALARLRTWLPELRTWGLSATLGNLPEARDVLLGTRGGAAMGRLVDSPLPKSVEIVTLIPPDVTRFPWAGHLGTSLLPQVIAAIENSRTTLLFTNTRSQAEIWFQRLVESRPDWVGQVAVHHGSLERDLRRTVEDLLGAGRLRCVVATSSLDLGVDFSPVDQVIQLGSPKGIARLMQRAGRSGHQPGALSRVLCVPTHAFELLEFAAARRAAAARRIEARVPLNRPLDVLAQHVVTVAAGGGFVAEELLAEVRTAWAYQALSAEEWQWVLDFVERGGPTLRAYPQYARVVVQEGRCVIASRAIERLHRLAIGTISSETSMQVKTVRGRLLGSIEEGFIARLQPGENFVFAGRVLELARVREMTAYVRPAKRGSGVIPRWQGGRFPLSTQLGAAVRETMSRAAELAETEPEVLAALPLLELQARQSRIPGPEDLLIEQTRTREGHHWFIYPFEGRLVHEGLAALFAYRVAAAQPATLTLTANDYGIELLSAQPIPLADDDWARLLRPGDLVRDLLACLNSTQMARRQFRDIARVAGLIFSGYPGGARTSRQLQASSDLFYDVFLQFDPQNLLLEQARREVLEQQLEVRRLADALERMRAGRRLIVVTERLSPLAFPLWADTLRAQSLSTERWAERVRRMAVQLEQAADRRSASVRRH